MELINHLFSDQLLNAIGWTIVHSIWQASFIALIMSLFLKKYQNEKSVVRYRIAITSLYMILGLSLITFCIYYTAPGTTSNLIVHTVGVVDITHYRGGDFIQNVTFGLVHHFDFITTMWISGMLVFFVKFLGGYLWLKRYELSGDVIQDTNIHVIFNDLIDKMNLERPVELLESALVNTPMMIGHLKPIILLPLGIVNHLELNEVEAILAHELSHISRNDFLQNIMQSFIEIVYYYHPAVWWISANVRAERENCCDEEAVRLCGSAVNYARALVKIEEMQSQGIPALAIPMSRNKNSLFNRVSRILNQPQNKSQIREKMVATVLLFSAFTLFGGSNISSIDSLENFFPPEKIISFTSDQGHFNVEVKKIEDCKKNMTSTKSNLIKKVILNSRNREIEIDTIPANDCNCSDVNVKSNGKNKSFSLQIDNGEVKELKINGVDIENADLYLKLNDDGKVIWENKNENEKVIWTVEGELLLKESGADTGFKDYEQYDFDELEDETILKAPFKLSGSHDVSRLEDLSHNILQEAIELTESLATLSNKKTGLSNSPIESKISWGFQSISIPEPPQPPTPPSPPNPPTPPTPPAFHAPVAPPMPPAPPAIPSDEIFESLLSDGLIEAGQQNTVELTNKYLKINGEKQPKNIWRKYIDFIESEMDLKLGRGTKIKLKERTN